MTFEAVVAEVRDGENRTEVLFRGRPAYYWFEPNPEFEDLLDQSRVQATALRIDWDPRDGRILSLFSGDAR